jgi:hypothetical protein
MNEEEFVKQQIIKFAINNSIKIDDRIKEHIKFGRDNPDTCKWILDSCDPNYYECDECGFAFVFMDGTPKDNHFHYCPGEDCGRKIIYE